MKKEKTRTNKQTTVESDTLSYKTYNNNCWKLAYFLGTTEEWYSKQIKILEKRVRTARRELPKLEIKMGELLKISEKHRLSKDEDRQLEEIGERLDDLTDIDLFIPMDTKKFRQFIELIRILGLIYLVAIFKGYLSDIVKEIFLKHPNFLKCGKQLTVDEILSQGGWDQILNYLAQNEADEIENASFKDVVKYFSDRFNINILVSGISHENITEIYLTRNIHIHNKGIVNKYFDKYVKNNKLVIGSYKHVTDVFLAESINEIDKLVKFIDANVKTKYQLI